MPLNRTERREHEHHLRTIRQGERVRGSGSYPVKDLNRTMKIIISNKVLLQGIPQPLDRELTDRLTFPNPAYLEAERMGRWLGELDEYLCCYERTTDGLLVPRGYTRQLIGLCKRYCVQYDIDDQRRTLPEVDFEFQGQLRLFQEMAVKDILSRDFGTVSMPTGSGKTVVSLYTIAKRRQPALVIVHTKELLYQWIDRIETFLGIHKGEVGIIGDGKKRVGEKITVGMVQTVYKCAEDIREYVGHLIVDECFTGDTKVSAPAGELEIQKINPGDVVKGYDHKTGQVLNTTVHHVFRRKAKTLCRVGLEGGRFLICTPIHPFFDGEKYVPAYELQKGKKLWRYSDERILSGVWKTETKHGEFLPRVQRQTQRATPKSDNCTLCGMLHTSPMPGIQALENFFEPSQSRSSLLFSRLCGGSEAGGCKESRQVFIRVQPDLGPDRKGPKQPDEKSGNSGENDSDQTKEWNPEAGTAEPRRERPETAKDSDATCRCFGMADGSADKDGVPPTNGTTKILVEKAQSSNLLQSGYRKSRTQSGCGNRRIESQREKEIAGSKETRTLKEIRVASVTFIEQTSRSGFGRMCPDGFVYNLETETGNYFAEGVLVHNCHRAPSRTFTEAVTAFDSKYMLGLSATPYRRDGLSRLIFWHLGDVVHEVDKEDLLQTGDIVPAEVVIRETDFRSLCNPSEEYTAMLTELTRDPERNQLIASDIAAEAKNGGGMCLLVLSDRKAHCDTLRALLGLCDVQCEVLTGDVANGKRQAIIDRLNQGKVKVLIATGQLIGEGFDCKGLSTLFLTTPIRFDGRVIQYLGRVLRPAPGKDKAKVYDYQDVHIPVLVASAKARERVFKSIS